MFELIYVYTMGLILDGNSEIGEHAQLLVLDLFKAFDLIENTVTNLRKDLFSSIHVQHVLSNHLT